MFPAERRQVLLDLVLRNGAVSLRELSRVAQTSEVTVRRDLRYLEEQGLLARRHGGAVALDGGSREPTYSEKSLVAAAEKRAIARAAAELVHDHDAVILGAGTTTQALAECLIHRNGLAVVTNSVLVAQVLARAPAVEVMVTGGNLRGSTFAMIGAAAERTLAGMRASKAFLSGNGLTAQRGLSTPNASVASMDRAIAAAAREVVVLADHTKIGIDAMVQTVPCGHVDRLFTDSASNADELAALREAGIRVDVVSLPA